MTRFGPYARYRGRAAEAAALSMLQGGGCGVVVDVRFSPNERVRFEDRGWLGVSVLVGAVSHEFRRARHGREPLVVRLPPGRTTVRAYASLPTTEELPSQMDSEIEVRLGQVVIVAVFPPTRGLILKRCGRLAIRSAYLDDSGSLVYQT